MKFKDKTVIVTGGGTGIGRETALLFAQQGANVVIIGRRIDKLRQVQKESIKLGPEIDFLVNDISDEEQCKAIVEYVVEKYGNIDILINNAGILLPGSTHEISSLEWDKTFNVNVRGMWLMSKYVIPHMIEQRGGAIVNSSSVIGLKGFAGVAAYAASKGAVAQLTRCMALEYAHNHIRVNAICPGFVETPLVTEGFLERAEDRDDAIAYMKSLHPLGRIATAKEVAHSILFLCDDNSGFITGHLLPVDGGWSAR
jgi:NAD(P)-dependent dehydrogenase (short-subunit alcohol dehydrogenase family)